MKDKKYIEAIILVIIAIILIIIFVNVFKNQVNISSDNKVKEENKTISINRNNTFVQNQDFPKVDMSGNSVQTSEERLRELGINPDNKITDENDDETVTYVENRVNSNIKIN